MSKQPQSLEARIISRALEDESFKQQLLGSSVEAKAAIEKEIRQKLPQDLQVNVLEETANVSYIVLPATASNQQMSEKQLEAVAGGAAICSAILEERDFIPPPCTFGSGIL